MQRALTGSRSRQLLLCRCTRRCTRPNTLSAATTLRFQRWGPVAPRELTFTYNLVRAGSNFKFVYLGRPDGLRAALDQGGLAALPGAQLEMVECDALSFRGWLAGLDRCRADNVRVPQRVTPGGLLIRDREASRYRSALFAEPIPRAGLEEIRALVSDKDGALMQAAAACCACV